MYTVPGRALEIDGSVQAELQAAIADVGGSIVRDWRSSATLALGGLSGAVADDQAVLGSLDGLADHATLVEGALAGHSDLQQLRRPPYATRGRPRRHGRRQPRPGRRR